MTPEGLGSRDLSPALVSRLLTLKQNSLDMASNAVSPPIPTESTLEFIRVSCSTGHGPGDNPQKRSLPRTESPKTVTSWESPLGHFPIQKPLNMHKSINLDFSKQEPVSQKESPPFPPPAPRLPLKYPWKLHLD